jgi:hypothetical protein
MNEPELVSQFSIYNLLFGGRMKQEAESLVDYLKTIIGEHMGIKLFGRSFEREGIGGSLKEALLEGDTVILDYTRDDESNPTFQILRIYDIESHALQYNSIPIYARAVLFEWCYDGREALEKRGMSTWKMEKVSTSREGDLINSVEFHAWNRSTEEDQFLTEAPAVRLLYWHSY